MICDQLYSGGNVPLAADSFNGDLAGGPVFHQIKESRQPLKARCLSAAGARFGKGGAGVMSHFMLIGGTQVMLLF